MQVSSSYNMSNIWDIDSSKKQKYSKVQEDTLPSGDSVDISEEAKRLYSEMIHKYDKTSSQKADGGEAEQNESGQPQGAAGAGGSLDSGSASDVESIKKQIQSLKSQIASLSAQTSGNTGGAETTAAMSKINSLQAQIAALEAQLNEMAAA